jgi:predicted CXXCH cytochrome family protein
LAVLLPLVAAIAAAGGCGTARPASPAARKIDGEGDGTRGASNILRGDYAGSAACAGCHADIFAAWRQSPMREMTRTAETARIHAPFDGALFRFKDDSARLSQQDGARFMSIQSREFGDHTYRVTRVIGGRYREDYAGVEVPATQATAPPGGAHPGHYRAGAELVLPVSYVFETRSFRLKGYSVMVGERPGLRAGGVWTETCVFCHNTTPYFDSTWAELFGPGGPGYQGTVVDRLLPDDRRWSFEVTDSKALGAALQSEVRFVTGASPAESDGRTLLRQSMQAIRTQFGAEHFVEIGIGCESCHGGSRAHTRDTRVLPDFAPQSTFMKVQQPKGWGPVGRAEWINRTCARCHQVLFSRYPFTWEGGARRGGGGGGGVTMGGSHTNSGEGRDFILGGCARQMSCVTCHDPHAADKPEALARLGTVAGNLVCTKCHTAYQSETAVRAHAHHDPAGAAGACVACHMPRKNMGLGYALTRYHRIGSPTDPARVERDRPMECALCHADKSVRQLVGDMERLWGHRYDRRALTDLYGDLDANVLLATARRGKAHEQAVAVTVLGERKVNVNVRQAVPVVARQLLNPFPLVRYYADRALSALRGQPCAVDLDRPTAEIEAAVRRCVPDAWKGAGVESVPSVAPSTRGARDHFDDD